MTVKQFFSKPFMSVAGVSVHMAAATVVAKIDAPWLVEIGVLLVAGFLAYLLTED